MGFGEQEFLHIRVSCENHIAIIQFNRSDSMNAANRQMVEEYHLAVEQANNDAGVKAMIITGNERVYCVGGDFSYDSCPTLAWNPGYALCLNHAHSKPKIAMISGYCLGGAVQQAMECDMRVASYNACFEIPDTLGQARVIYTAPAGAQSRIINAREALRIGMVNMVVEQQTLKETTIGLACLISKPTTRRGQRRDISAQ